METTGKKPTKISKHEIKCGVHYNYLDLKKECFEDTIFSVYGFKNPTIEDVKLRLACRYCNRNIFFIERMFYQCNKCLHIYSIQEKDTIVFLKTIEV